jgi:thiol:disulfide interchange protein DsbA
MRSLCAAALGLGFASPSSPPPSPLRPPTRRTASTTPPWPSRKPVQATGKKVEVIEFFMYHCPVCNALEPGFEEWVRKQGDRIVVRRVHYPFTGPSDPEAHLYLTLEALGRLGDMHAKVFKAVHVDRVRLNQDQAIIDWVAKNGVDRATFLNAWNSFGVAMRLRQLGKVVADYKVDSAPTLVIDGRWVTSPAMVNAGLKTKDREALFQATLQVADALVEKAAKAK